MPDPSTSTTNAAILRDCFSAELLKRITSTSSPAKSKRPSTRSKKRASSITSKSQPPIDQPAQSESLAEDLSDFIDYLSQELFTSLPLSIQTLSYPDTPSHEAESLLSIIPTSVTDSLETYSLLPSSTSATNLLHSTLTSYLASATSAPPQWSTTRTSACEICARDWIPLTYHHLIPRSVHDKVRKRGWHAESMLGSVAWLCRACHSFVHGLESNEVLAREYFTVERLVEREDVRRWAGWVGRVRWKAR